MKKLVLLGLFFPIWIQAASAQRPAMTSPVVRFQDQNGEPLMGGRLYSYQAGTTTPIATYKDSTTGALNTNPVILDATGSARVFLGANVYKFVLQNAFGVVQWTADNIAEGAFQSSYVSSVFGRSGAVIAQAGDYNCSQVTGAVCSTPRLYYQTVQAGGSAAAREPILNLIAGVSGSVGAPTVTAGGSGYTGAPSVAFSGGACVTQPTGSTTVSGGAVASLVLVTPGVGCTSAPAAAFSGGGGAGAAATVALLPDGIACVDNPARTSTDCTLTFGGGGGSSLAPLVQTDLTTVRAFNTSYQNTTSGPMYVSGRATLTGGSGDSTVTCLDGPAAAYLTVWGQTTTATVPGESLGFSCFVPAGYFYRINTANHLSSAPGSWFEYTGFGGGGGGQTSLAAGSGITVNGLGTPVSPFVIAATTGPTAVTAGTGIAVSGVGTSGSPFVIAATGGAPVGTPNRMSAFIGAPASDSATLTQTQHVTDATGADFGLPASGRLTAGIAFGSPQASVQGGALNAINACPAGMPGCTATVDPGYAGNDLFGQYGSQIGLSRILGYNPMKTPKYNTRVEDKRNGKWNSAALETNGIAHQINSINALTLYRPTAVTITRASNIATIALPGTDTRWCEGLAIYIWGDGTNTFNTKLVGSNFQSIGGAAVGSPLQLSCSATALTFTSTGTDVATPTSAFISAVPLKKVNLQQNFTYSGAGNSPTGGENAATASELNCTSQMKAIVSCGHVVNAGFWGTGDFQYQGYSYLLYHHQVMGNHDDEDFYARGLQFNEFSLAPAFTVLKTQLVGGVAYINHLYLQALNSGLPGGGHYLLTVNNADHSSASFYSGNITAITDSYTPVAGMSGLYTVTVDTPLYTTTPTGAQAQAWGTNLPFMVPPNSDAGFAISTLLQPASSSPNLPYTGWACFFSEQRSERESIAVSSTVTNAGQAYNLRGAWASSTAYAIGDVVNNSGQGYIATAAFTSGTTFSTANLAVVYQMTGSFRNQFPVDVLHNTPLTWFQGLGCSAPSGGSVAMKIGAFINNQNTQNNTNPTAQVVPIMGALDAHTLVYALPSSGFLRSLSNIRTNILPESASGRPLTRVGGVVTLGNVPLVNAKYEKTNWCGRAITISGATDSTLNGTFTSNCTATPPGTLSWQQTGADTSGTANAAAGNTFVTGGVSTARNAALLYPMNEIVNTVDEKVDDRDTASGVCANLNCYLETAATDYPYAAGQTVEDDIAVSAFYADHVIQTCYSSGCESDNKSIGGDGIAGIYVDKFLGNYNPTSMYQFAGGPLTLPLAALSVAGPWQNIMDLRGSNSATAALAPNSTVITTGCALQPAGTTNALCTGAQDQFSMLDFGTATNTTAGRLMINQPNSSLDLFYSWYPGAGPEYSFGHNGYTIGRFGVGGTINGPLLVNSGLNVNYGGVGTNGASVFNGPLTIQPYNSGSLTLNAPATFNGVTTVPTVAAADSSLNAANTATVHAIVAGLAGGYTLGGTLSGSVAPIGSTPAYSYSGLDGSHQLTITTGTSVPSAGALGNVTFTASRGHVAYCVAYPANAAAAGVGSLYFSAWSATSYTFSQAGSSEFSISTTYIYNVSCP